MGIIGYISDRVRGFNDKKRQTRFNYMMSIEQKSRMADRDLKLIEEERRRIDKVKLVEQKRKELDDKISAEISEQKYGKYKKFAKAFMNNTDSYIKKVKSKKSNLKSISGSIGGGAFGQSNNRIITDDVSKRSSDEKKENPWMSVQKSPVKRRIF